MRLLVVLLSLNRLAYVYTCTSLLPCELAAIILTSKCVAHLAADNGTKFLYIDGDAAGLAYTKVGGVQGMRGFAYWDIKQDDPK